MKLAAAAAVLLIASTAHAGALVWLVGPDIPAKDPSRDLVKTKVALEIVDAHRTIALKPEFGSLRSDNQPSCKGRAYPLETNEVGKLTFYEGGAGGYLVKQNGDLLDIRSWSLTDGACEGKNHDPVACPRKTTHIAYVKLPANTKLHDTIVMVDDKGTRSPFQCDSSD
jgi:hypothetical protein